MVLAILGSYAVQFYVPMEIIWPTISNYFHTSQNKLIAEYTFRTVLVLVTCKYQYNNYTFDQRLIRFLRFAVCLAAAIPKLDLFISLVGAFSSSFLVLIDTLSHLMDFVFKDCLYPLQALVFPPVLELITYWPNPGRWILAKNSLIIVFGIIGFLAGTYASIESLVNAFST